MEMIDKRQMIIWKRIGYEAQNIICLTDSDFGVNKVKETAQSIKNRIGLLDTNELDKIKAQNGVSVKEYASYI